MTTATATPTEAPPLYRQWRERWQREFDAGERLEKIAEQHAEIPFECSPDYGTPQIKWCAWGLTLQEFARRTKMVAAIFGAPDTVTGEHYGSAASATSTPPLEATWHRDGYDIVVGTYSPTGCKLDPRSEFQEAKYPQIHPECAAVLKQLEDAGGEACP